MSRFQQISPSDSEQVSTLYKEIASYGFGAPIPINWFSSQSSRPDILASSWAFCKAILVEGQLPATVKQMIATTISVQNNCRYCSVLHSNTMATLGVSPEVVESCVRDPELSRIQQPYHAILKFALKVAKTPSSVTDEDYHLLWEQGLTNEEILEVVALAAFTNFINTWADVSGLQLDGSG